MIIVLFLSVSSMYKTATKGMVLEKCFNRPDCSFDNSYLRWGIYNSTGPYVIKAIFTHPRSCPYPFTV